MHTPAPLNRSLRELRSRLDYVNHTWTAESYGQLARFFVNIVPKLLDAERCSIFLRDPSTDRIRSMLGTELGDEPIEPPLEGSVVGRVIAGGEPAVVNHLSADSGFHLTADAQTGFQTRSVLCVPIKGVTGDRVIGAIEVLNKLSGDGFLSADLAVLEEISAYLSVALDNIVLNAEISRISVDLGREVARFQSSYLKDMPFVAESDAMRGVLELVRMVCDTPVHVLIRGENGTGKEVIARMIHEGRDRRGGPFVSVNCAAVPEHLMESEFFGYEKGAFTGATAARKGRFEEAAGGTLFLDEVADIPISMQAKFLRALQEEEGARLGANLPVKYQFGLISATNQNLRERVRQDRFREDLFYRLFAVEIEIPPLRERPDDVAPLTIAFIEDVCRKFGKAPVAVSGELIAVFESYRWPGNVRQLRREIERLVALTPPGQPLSLAHCSPELVKGAASAPLDSAADLSIPVAVEALEVKLIETALERTGGNKLGAAKLLGITRQGLHKKLKRYRLEHGNVSAAKDATPGPG